MRPIVGICAAMGADGAYLPEAYVDAVRRGGGLPVILPVGEDVAAVLAAVDGLVFPGGQDFDTERLGLGPVHPEARPVPTVQQDWNVALSRAALDVDIPVLGICYGMQLLGLVGGGTLDQHLAGHLGPEDAPLVAHTVSVEPASVVAAALGCTEADVVSGHHQAISSVGERWVVSACAPDGVIEAIERPDRRFAVGVQWHPERSPAGSLHDGLFRTLCEVAAAGSRPGAKS